MKWSLSKQITLLGILFTFWNKCPFFFEDIFRIWIITDVIYREYENQSKHIRIISTPVNIYLEIFLKV